MDVEIVDCNLQNTTNDPDLKSAQPDPNSLVCYKADTTCHKDGKKNFPEYVIAFKPDYFLTVLPYFSFEKNEFYMQLFGLLNGILKKNQEKK